MAAKVVELTFTWDNEVNITVETKVGPDTFSLVNMDENGSLNKLMPAVAQTITLYIEHLIEEITRDMRV